MAVYDCKLGVIGAGAMGGAIAAGLASSSALPSGAVSACDHHADKLSRLEKLGVATYTTAEELLASDPDVVVLAVKPQVLFSLLDEIATALSGRLVISIAAGVSLGSLEDALPGARVVRAMPNLPIQVKQGATALAKGSTASEADVSLVRSVFGALGVCEVMREDQLDAEGAVVGCGPAFFALMVDALTRAGVRAGLPAASLRPMVASTMGGVAAQLLSSGEHPRAYMEKVTSPGGTTAEALKAFEPALVEGSYAAIDAALARTRELAG
jgi:pyrroline-5-carboxylate reductase